MKPFIDYQRTVAGAGSGPHTVTSRVFVVILALALGGMAGSAYGLGETCTVSSNGVSFGVYNVFNSVDNDSVGTIQVSCSALAAIRINYSIELNKGGSNSYTLRSMSGGAGHSLNYNLYTDTNRTIVWGDGTGGTQTVSGSFSLTLFIHSDARDHAVYGRIPARQNAYVGSYTDTTITITINF